MASGRVHFISNVAMGVGVGYLVYNNIPDALPYAIIGLTIGTLITPDMDLEGTTYTERLMRHIPGFGWLWQINWYGYALLFKHRGFSHNWFIGTLTRITWLLLILGFFYIVTTGIIYTTNFLRFTDLNVPVMDFSRIENVHIEIVTVIVICWYLEDWNHYILDFIFSENKKRHKKKDLEYAKWGKAT